MNVLSREKQAAVIQGLIEGNSIRSVERMTGIHRDTIMRVLRRTGDQCQRIMDERVRNLRCREIQADELWTFVGKKQRRLDETEKLNPELGDQSVFVAFDTTSKLLASFRVGKRELSTALPFMKDLASRFAPHTRVQ